MPTNNVYTTVIPYEEQMRGWLAIAARARTTTQLLEAYVSLDRHIATFKRIPTLSFDGYAAVEYDRLRQNRLRVGAMDLKIAAIVISNHATLSTLNVRDFEKIPDLVVEDWSV